MVLPNDPNISDLQIDLVILTFDLILQFPIDRIILTHDLILEHAFQFRSRKSQVITMHWTL